MIHKNQLQLGDILETNHPDTDFKFYIYCSTPDGINFISKHGRMFLMDFDNDLKMIDREDSGWDIVKVYRPQKYKHTNQTRSFGYLRDLKIPLADILAHSIEITNINEDINFTNLLFYV